MPVQFGECGYASAVFDGCNSASGVTEFVAELKREQVIGVGSHVPVVGY